MPGLRSLRTAREIRKKDTRPGLSSLGTAREIQVKGHHARAQEPLHCQGDTGRRTPDLGLGASTLPGRYR